MEKHFVLFLLSTFESEKVERPKFEGKILEIDKTVDRKKENKTKRYYKSRKKDIELK